MAATGVKIVAKNQKAYHEYFIEEKFEAGIELSAELNPSGDPLELVAQLEARAGSDAEKASLKGLQNLIRENNISLERQKRSTVSNEIRSAVYLVTMLKDCLIKREIIGKELQNFEDKKKQITAALPKMKAAEANQYKQVLASLDKGIALSKTGIGNQEAEFRSMLLFYKQTVENTRKVPQSLFDEELKGIGQENVRQGPPPRQAKRLTPDLQEARRRTARRQAGPALVGCAQKGHPVIDSQGEMIHKWREKNSPSSSILLRTYRFHSPFPAFLYPSDDLELIHPFPSLVLSTPRSFSARFPSIPYL